MAAPPEHWKSCELFHHIDKDELESLYKAFEEEIFLDGDYLIREGEEGSDFFIIDSGHVDILKDGLLIAQKSAGDYFGIMSLLDSSKRSADVRANGRLVTMRTSYSNLKACTSEYVCEKILSNHFIEVQKILRGMNETTATELKQRLDKTKEIEAIRTSISSDLHDDVGSILAGIALQTELLSMESPSTQVKEISERSREAMENMRDIVWSIDDRKNKYGNLFERMDYFIENNLNASKFNYHFNVIGIKKQDAIPKNLRKTIYLVYKEAITNIAKHSSGNIVDITLEKTDNSFILTVMDNGNIQGDISEDGMGLSNMKLRARNVNGSLRINTKSGFELKLIAPLES